MRTKTTTMVGKKLTAVLITLAMALGWVLAPRVALALQGGKTVACLGTSGIEVPNAGWSKGTGSYVYYGTYNGTPTKYRVLSNGGGAMLLDCDMLLYTSWFDDHDPLTNVWSDSLVRSDLNASAFFDKDGNLTEAEKGAIRETSITESGKTSTDKVFLLSVAEVNGGYYAEGYGPDALSARIKSTGVKTDVWWLRSASSYTYSNGDPCAVVVNENGYVVTPNSSACPSVRTENIRVSPAFNIKLSSVIFSSVISGEAGKPGAEYKLTLIDGESLDARGTAILKDGKPTITYTATGQNVSQASYIVTDKAWDNEAGCWSDGAQKIAYGKLGEASDGETTVEFALPKGYSIDGWGKDYHVYVLAENVNGTQYTDYASAPVEVQLDKPEPTTYKVTVAEGIQNGNVSVDKAEAAAGDTVKVTAKAADGYELDTVTVKDAYGKQIETRDGSFTMPANDVTVSATFTKKAEPEPQPEPTPVAVPDASVTAHVQRIGWMGPVTDGGAAGTTGKSRRMEALRLTLPEGVAGGIEYRSHVQRTGWEETWAADGAQSGTTGKSRRMEAVQIRLTGDAEKTYDVYYRVHVQRIGWMAWAKNGEEAGTNGMSRRAEAIQVVLVKKDTPAPDATFKGVTQSYDKACLQK